MVSRENLGKLGPFLLQSVLGEGGMGRVFEGVHASTGKRYAISPRLFYAAVFAPK